MNFSEALKAKRKEFGMSQDQLAEKLCVSRQAITKWETGGGMPDIENMLAIASLFGTTVEELVSPEKLSPSGAEYFHESSVEYDIDTQTDYDINIGGAREIYVSAHNSEKLKIKLASNALSEIERLFKIKIDSNKYSIDVNLKRSEELSEAKAKDALSVYISVPAKLIENIELAARVHTLRLSGFEAEKFEFDGKVTRVNLDEFKGKVELNSSSDMIVVCSNLDGEIGIDQISATSTIHLPKGTEYQTKIKRAAKKISYTLDGTETQAPENHDTQNIIKLSGLNTELVINECSDITQV